MLPIYSWVSFGSLWLLKNLFVWVVEFMRVELFIVFLFNICGVYCDSPSFITDIYNSCLFYCLSVWLEFINFIGLLIESAFDFIDFLYCASVLNVIDFCCLLFPSFCLHWIYFALFKLRCKLSFLIWDLSSFLT